MKITDLLKKESIELHGQVKTKEEAIDRMVELMVRSGNIRDENAYKQGVLKREAEGTTGIGGGIAHSPCQELRCGAGWFKCYGGTWRCGL